MLSTVQPGLVGEAHTLVDDSNVASAYGSGAVDVFATPAMIALMEGAAASCVAPFLPSGSVSVGTRVDVRHLAATPVGVLVTARAELIEVDGRRLVFQVSASDSVEVIGEGTHERMIVDLNRLLARASSKAQVDRSSSKTSSSPSMSTYRAPVCSQPLDHQPAQERLVGVDPTRS